jgi:cation transport regulator ChaB
MPAKGSSGEFAELPSTLARSPKKAQDTYEATLESAETEYAGDEARAHRTAWAAVKHSFEKHGDHWETKDERGDSDPGSAEGGPDSTAPSYGGANVSGKTKDELLDEARAAGAHATTHMTKDEIGKELQHANDRATAATRTK